MNLAPPVTFLGEEVIQKSSVLRSEAVHGGRRGEDNQRCGRCSGFSTRPSVNDSKIQIFKRMRKLLNNLRAQKRGLQRVRQVGF